jgi:hypothetical protein
MSAQALYNQMRSAFQSMPEITDIKYGANVHNSIEGEGIRALGVEHYTILNTRDQNLQEDINALPRKLNWINNKDKETFENDEEGEYDMFLVNLYFANVTPTQAIKTAQLVLERRQHINIYMYYSEEHVDRLINHDDNIIDLSFDDIDSVGFGIFVSNNAAPATPLTIRMSPFTEAFSLYTICQNAHIDIALSEPDNHCLDNNSTLAELSLCKEVTLWTEDLKNHTTNNFRTICTQNLSITYEEFTRITERDDDIHFENVKMLFLSIPAGETEGGIMQNLNKWVRRDNDGARMIDRFFPALERIDTIFPEDSSDDEMEDGVASDDEMDEA